MKRLNVKKTALVAFISISGITNAQWNPTWYPGLGFTPMFTDAKIKDALPWAVGGNQVTTLMSFPGTNNYRIGTTDGAPFELMASGTEMMHMDQSSRVGIGANIIPSIPNCVLDIGGTGSAFRIYGDASGNVHASEDLKIHYGSITNGNPYRFELNQGTPGGSTPRFSIDAFGLAKVYNRMDVGANMIVGTGARLGVDGTSSDGVVIIGNNGNNGNGNKALLIANNAGAGRVRVWINAGGGDDTKMHIAGSTQIGFYQSPGGLVDNNTRLNVDAFGPNGVKVTTNNNTIKAFSVDNSNFINQPFVVYGDGKTHIGPGRPLITGVAASAMLSVDGMILARDVRVAISQATHWADYVFDKDYKLMSLNEVEKYVSKNKHLPGVPSEAEVKTEGVDLVEMNINLLQKVEELYLHTIELQKQMEQQQKELKALKNK